MEPSTAAHPGGGGSEEGEVVAASAEVEPEEGEVVAASAEVELEDALGGATAEPGGSGGTGGAGRGGDPRAGESPPAAPAERGNGMPKPGLPRPTSAAYSSMRVMVPSPLTSMRLKRAEMRS